MTRSSKLTWACAKLEDVQAWLREHLGVPPLTDLARLFAETIGIPQGTFTADFLKRPNDRKKIFDPILKVEEYKQTYEQLRDLETYGKAQVSTLNQQLIYAEQQLADWGDLQQQAEALRGAIAQHQTQIEQLTQQIEQLQVEVNQLSAAAEQVQTLEVHNCVRLSFSLPAKPKRSKFWRQPGWALSRPSRFVGCDETAIRFIKVPKKPFSSLPSSAA